MRIATALIPALIPVLALSMVACDDTGDDTDAIVDVPTETAKVRLAHFGVFPDGADSAVDVFVNGAASGITFSFKDTTDYVELPVGTYTFDIVPAGGAIEDSVFTVADFELAADQTWSVYAAGAPLAIDGQQDFTVGAFQDDASDIAMGNIRLNVVHAAALTALDPVDVWVVDANCAPAGNEPLLANFAFGATSGNLDIPAGALGVGFDIGGDATVDACFQVPDLGGDQLVNVYAVNDAAGNVSIVAHTPNGMNAEVTPTEIPEPTGAVRLAHFGVFPDGVDSSVDVFVNGAPSGITFAFKDTTDYVALPVGTYDFDIVPSGGTIENSVFQVADFAINDGDTWSVFAAGAAAPIEGQNGFTVSAFADDDSAIPSGNIRLNIIHAAALTALDPVDVWLVDDNCAPAGTEPLLPGFEFTDTSGTLDIPASALGVGFDIGANATVDACFQVPNLGGDQLVNVYATNTAAGAVSLVAHLPDGSMAEVTPSEL